LPHYRTGMSKSRRWQGREIGVKIGERGKGTGGSGGTLKCRCQQGSEMGVGRG
ncbi:hypothetical protein ACLOJK_003688, partial [Asimina triloba]